MSDGSCQRFNNAAQKACGSIARPVVLPYKTNDKENPWYADARVVYFANGEFKVLGQGRASTYKKAKDAAAAAGYQYLKATFPSLNL